jgi:hypothetical protein
MILLAQQLTLPGDDGTITGPLKGSTFGSLGSSITLGSIISRATLFVFAFAGMGLLIMLIMAGFTYLTSAGDAKKLSQAQSQLTNAIIGFIIIFCAFWIVQLVGTIFGIDTIIGSGGIFSPSSSTTPPIHLGR